MRVVLARAMLPAAVVVAVSIGLVAACSSPASNGSGGPSSASTPTSPAGPTAGASSAASSSAGGASSPASSNPSTKPSAAAASVDLTLTGTYSATVKGTKGCQIGKRSDGTYTFGWFAGEKDYPGLYDVLQVSQSNSGNGDFLDIKWIIRGPIGFLNDHDIPYAGDGHSVTLDAELASGTDKVHISGTITCP